MTAPEKPAEMIEFNDVLLHRWAEITDDAVRGTIDNDLDLTIRNLARALLAAREQIRAKDENYEALEMDIAALDFNLRQEIRAKDEKLARLREAVEKVPHLITADGDVLVKGIIVDDEADRMLHEKDDCADLGGRCALDALLAETSRKDGKC